MPNSNLKIVSIRASPQVKFNDTYEIIVSVKNSNWISIYGRLCIYDGINIFVSSTSYKFGANETVDFQFTGPMPNRKLELKSSLVHEALGYIENCADAKYFTIQLASPGEPTTPPPPPPTPPGEDDNGWDWPDIPGIPGGGDNIVTTIMDNIVIILILAIVLILILKFA